MSANVDIRLISSLSELTGSITTAQVTGLDAALATASAHIASTSNPHSTTKAQVGLGNADNTSDASKPISTATQTALDAKAALSHTHTASQVTDFAEAVDDRVGALLVAGANVTLTYDDAGNTLTIASSGGGGGGSLAIGDAVGSATATYLAYFGTSGVLAQSSKMAFDGNRLSLSATAGTAGLEFNRPGNAQWGIGVGTESVGNLYIGASATVATDWFWRANWNDTTRPTNTFRNPSGEAGCTVLAAVGASGQTAPFFEAISYGGTALAWIAADGKYHGDGSALTGTASGLTAGLATNGVVTTGSYADPSWITSLAKSKVGLGSVDNTSDASKPVSTAQQTALDLKANLASPTLTGTPTAPTATAGTNTTQLATTAFVLANAGSSPGGTSGQVQYNNGSGGFAASANVVYDGTELVVTGNNTGLKLTCGANFGTFRFASNTNTWQFATCGSGNGDYNGSWYLYNENGGASGFVPFGVTKAGAIGIGGHLEGVTDASVRGAVLTVSTAGQYAGINMAGATPSAALHVVSSGTGQTTLAAQAAASQTANVAEFRNASNVMMSGVSPKGAFLLATLADSDAPSGSLYLGSDHSGGLCYKDAGGTVHTL